MVKQEVGSKVSGVDSSRIENRNEGSALTSSLRQGGAASFGGGGLGSWKWAKEQGQEAGRTIA